MCISINLASQQRITCIFCIYPTRAMGLEELECGNTKRAKVTALASFKKFLKTENVSDEYVRACIKRDESEKASRWLETLQCNTTGKLKYDNLNSFLSIEPHWRGGRVTNAPPYSNGDLKRMILFKRLPRRCLTLPVVVLVWTGVRPRLAAELNVSIDASKVLFVRFIRMKTSEEQGLSLFPYPAFATCPLLAIALALISQAAPSSDAIDNLPEVPSHAAIDLAPEVPLVNMLDNPTTSRGVEAPTTAGLDTTTTIYAHINRVLDRISKQAGVVDALTSHSFRSGGPQHANASGRLTARWIFDRGA
ncbi:RxLR effector protein [Phytophthora megakarya]|uniref:RxLR effector protein n=1 Tax=Phytophthora megakarya TaxID=4795 RepID=A0A225VW18_9STRA|nr:RxLR effector protein [Phytophthora megakarya]